MWVNQTPMPQVDVQSVVLQEIGAQNGRLTVGNHEVPTEGTSHRQTERQRVRSVRSDVGGVGSVESEAASCKPSTYRSPGQERDD